MRGKGEKGLTRGNRKVKGLYMFKKVLIRTSTIQ